MNKGDPSFSIPKKDEAAQQTHYNQRRTKMKWGPQAKLIDEALLKYYFVNISLLPRYIFIQKVVKTHNIT